MFIADHNLPMGISQPSHVHNSEILNLMVLMIYFL